MIRWGVRVIDVAAVERALRASCMVRFLTGRPCEDYVRRQATEAAHFARLAIDPRGDQYPTRPRRRKTKHPAGPPPRRTRPLAPRLPQRKSAADFVGRR